MMQRVVVAVFVHSDSPSPLELISFQQCFRILGKHPIRVFARKGLTLDAYRAVVADFPVVFLDEKWQSNIESYNKLKLSRYFYKHLDGYEFLLTYELDAFVFRDELLAWCEKGYDYIGAPWFEGFAQPSLPLTFKGVGNSGFSLRRIEAIKRLILNTGYGNIYTQPGGRKNKLRSLVLDPWVKMRSYWDENPVIQKAESLVEDKYLFYTAKRIDPRFDIAPISEAVKFSFEVCPEYLYCYNDNQLPFGCHAWWRYNPGFWKPQIEKFGYRIP